MFDCGYERSFCEYLKAGDPSASPEELAVLAKHSDYRIRRRIAENPATPAALLNELAGDRDADVRIAVGTNTAASEYLKLRLACDGDTTVRLGLAQEITTPQIVLHQLIHDENAWVAGEAIRTLQIQNANRGTTKRVADFVRHRNRRNQSDAVPYLWADKKHERCPTG